MVSIHLSGLGDHLMALIFIALGVWAIIRYVKRGRLLAKIEREAGEVFFHEGDPDKLAQSLYRIGYAIEPGAWPAPPDGEEL